LHYSGIILFLIFFKNDSPAVFLPCFYYGGPEKLRFKSESYVRGDSFSCARPPSLVPSISENPPPNTIQITVQQIITSHTSDTKLLTIGETLSTDNDQKNEN
jgi:hypothetical protein